MNYKQKLEKALRLNKDHAIIFYSMQYAKGDLIKLEEFLDGKTDKYTGGPAKSCLTT